MRACRRCCARWRQNTRHRSHSDGTLTATGASSSNSTRPVAPTRYVATARGSVLRSGKHIHRGTSRASSSTAALDRRNRPLPRPPCSPSRVAILGLDTKSRTGTWQAPWRSSFEHGSATPALPASCTEYTLTRSTAGAPPLLLLLLLPPISSVRDRLASVTSRLEAELVRRAVAAALLVSKCLAMKAGKSAGGTATRTVVLN